MKCFFSPSKHACWQQNRTKICLFLTGKTWLNEIQTKHVGNLKSFIQRCCLFVESARFLNVIGILSFDGWCWLTTENAFKRRCRRGKCLEKICYPAGDLVGSKDDFEPRKIYTACWESSTIVSEEDGFENFLEITLMWYFWKIFRKQSFGVSFHF